MQPMLAQKQIAIKLIKAAKDFLLKMQEKSFDDVWDYSITPEAAELLSTSLLPMFTDKENKIDELLKPVVIEETMTSMDEIFPLAFQMNLDDMRTEFFRGLESGFEATGWYEANFKDALAFTQGSCAILIDPGTKVPLMIQFLKQNDGSFIIDLESLVLFSMAIPPSLICKIGDQALATGQTKTGIVYFQLAACYEKAFSRLKMLVLNHMIVSKLVTDERKAELNNEGYFINIAKQHVSDLLNKPEVTANHELDSFLLKTFEGYSEIPKTELMDTELKKLFELDDSTLRSAIAAMMKGVDPVIANREAKKPHGSFEISDMEVIVKIDNRQLRLSIPVKTGLEIKTNKVPESYLYQIIRPFLYFPNGVVVFITAKPCSQNLHNDLKLARDNQGFAVEVIEYEDLGKLLKINGLLN